MGKGGGGSVKTQTVAAEEPVTPAVAQNVAEDAETAETNQAERRARMRGIRSTYNRFASEQGAGANGAKKTLG